LLLAIDDKRIMDCPRLGNIYVFPVEGNQKDNYDDIWKHN